MKFKHDRAKANKVFDNWVIRAIKRDARKAQSRNGRPWWVSDAYHAAHHAKATSRIRRWKRG